MPTTIDDTSQAILASQICSEHAASSSSQEASLADFETTISMLDCESTPTSYEWMSDDVIPEYASIVLTESSQWAEQYFPSRDFVDCYLETDEPDGPAKCQAAKKLINKTLNRRGLNYYHKYIRARIINSTCGYVYAITSWSQVLKKEQTGVKQVAENTYDEYGPYVSLREEPVISDIPVIDHFNLDILDPRNVFASNEYTYSIQDKKFIIIRSEQSLEELKAKELTHGYFNLDKLSEIALPSSPQRTETAQSTYDKDTPQDLVKYSGSPEFDVLERYGKLWAIVKSTDEYGNPTEISSPYNPLGELSKKAQLIKGIMTIAKYGTTNTLIRYQPVGTIDNLGRPYFPVLRGLCYIHPTKDTGMSSGKYSSGLQSAINTTFRMSQDRVHLATLPTFKGKKYSVEDNTEIRIDPEHVIPLDYPTNDLQELVIRDNINGALQQISMLTSGLQKVNAVYPTTMGDVPGMASTTATAVAGADSRSSSRASYKSMTFEYTFLCDLYWHILQQSYQNMHPSTALELLGEELVMVFDPGADYTFKPVSSNIEQEQSKRVKMQLINQTMATVVNIPNPKTPMIVNKLMVKYFELLGAEYNDIKDALLDESVPPPMLNQGGTNPEGSQPNNMTEQGAPSNQYGVPQSITEDSVRGTGGVNAIQ